MAEHLDWDSPSQVGSHAYARCFLRDGAELLWLTSACTPAHLIFSNSLAPQKLERWKGNARTELEPGLRVYSPMTVLPSRNSPILSSYFVARHSMRFTIPNLASWLRSRGWQDVDLLWITNPLYVGLLDSVKHRCSVYRIADNTAAYRTVPSSFRRIEGEVIERVDHVFVANRAMLGYALKLNSRAQYLPNGVDAEVFSSAEASEEYLQIPSPRAVYVGALDERMDIGLVEHLACSHPEISYCLIGPITTSISSLSKLPNVHFLGCVEQRRLAGYLKCADVGIIPFVRNDLTEHLNPLKLLQYLACGLPVVSTDLVETRALESPAVLVSTPEEFSDAIREALSKGKDRPECYRYALSNSWDSRYETVKASFFGCRAKLQASEH